MFRSAIKSQRLVVVFLLGVLLFNYPLLALFNRTASVAGIPRALPLHLRRVGVADRPRCAGRRALALARRFAVSVKRPESHRRNRG